jgi:hypothetical protein
MKRAEEHRREMLDLAGPSENAIKLGPIKWDNLTERADDLRAKLGVLVLLVQAASLLPA